MEAVRRRATDPDPARRVALSRRFTTRYALAVVLLGVLFLVTLVTGTRNLDTIERLNDESAAVASATDAVTDAMLTVTRLQDEAGQPPEADLLDELRVAVDVIDGASAQFGATYPGTPTAATISNVANLSDAFRSQFTIMDPGTRVDRYLDLIEEGDKALLRLTELQSSVNDDIDGAVDSRRATMVQLGVSWLVVAGLVVLFIFRPMSRSIREETSQLEAAERMQRENNERQTFRNDTKQALENTENEDEVLEAVSRALVDVVPDDPAELLLVDDSKAHLRSVLAHPLTGSPTCPVDAPGGCAALRRGQPLVFESSRMLNVCPKLPQHGAPCSAVCVPLTFMSESLGVLHLTAPDGQPPDSIAIERLKVVAGEAGSRLGTMRAMHITQVQADTDGLTGLLNRRSLETRARELLGSGREFSVAMGDLDHFKQMNDRFGHEAGDRALRLFAKALKANLRPGDIAARYGGEEFVVVLPNANILEAQRVLERFQMRLAADIAAAPTVPAFTASWGLTDTSAGENLTDILAVADAALYDAKRNGRNCIVVDGAASRSLVREQHPDKGGGTVTPMPTGPGARWREGTGPQGGGPHDAAPEPGRRGPIPAS